MPRAMPSMSAMTTWKKSDLKILGTAFPRLAGLRLTRLGGPSGLRLSCCLMVTCRRTHNGARLPVIADRARLAEGSVGHSLTIADLKSNI